MNFRPELAEAVLSGSKTVTRRVVSDNPRSPYHPDRAPKMAGKRIAICPGRGKPRIGEATVAFIERHWFHPWIIKESEARREGFICTAEFVETWKRMHGLETVEVWRIELSDPASTEEPR